MSKREIIWFALLTLLVIGVFALSVSIFKNKRVDTTGYDIAIKAKDETISAIKETREAYKEMSALKNVVIAEHKKQDSLLATKQKQTIIKYETVPLIVNDLTDDELFHAIIERYNN